VNSKEAHKIYLERRVEAHSAWKEAENARAAYEKAEHEFWMANARAVKACNKYTRLVAKEAEGGE